MSRRPIHSDRIENATVSAALQVHVAERNGILDRLTCSFQDDLRIRAAWLWGSFLRGDQDDLSDLDIWILVPKESIPGFGGVISKYCQAAGVVVTSGENAHNAPTGGGYFSALLAGKHGLQQLDFYWQGVGEVQVPEGNLLVNRIDQKLPLFEPEVAQEAGVETELLSCLGKISFIWLMLSVSAKYLARDPSSDMKLLSYPRNSFEETGAILGLTEQIGEVEWTTSDNPSAKVSLLREVLGKTLILEQACRKHGLLLSEEANPCLSRYFDLVEGLLMELPALAR
jgi:hypothetical protein